MIISVLMILIIPNLSGKSDQVYKKGCKALVSVVQAQVDAYQLDKGSIPNDLDTLVVAGYITPEQKQCPNGEGIIYENGKVSTP